MAAGTLETGRLDVFQRAFEPKLQTEGAGSGQPPRRTAVGVYDSGNEDESSNSGRESSHPSQPSIPTKSEYAGLVYKNRDNYKRGLRGFMQEAYDAGLMRPKTPIGHLRYQIVHLPIIGRFLYF